MLFCARGVARAGVQTNERVDRRHVEHVVALDAVQRHVDDGVGLLVGIGVGAYDDRLLDLRVLRACE